LTGLGIDEYLLAGMGFANIGHSRSLAAIENHCFIILICRGSGGQTGRSHHYRSKEMLLWRRILRIFHGLNRPIVTYASSVSE
jgi:hypothetical protein